MIKTQAAKSPIASPAMRLMMSEGGIVGGTDGDAPNKFPTPMKRAMAAKTNATSTTSPPMARMTEIIMLLNMRLSPRMSEMYLTATSAIINPAIERTGPTDGTIPSSPSIDPTPPSVFAWESEGIQEPRGRVEDINVCGIFSSHLASEIEQREYPCYRE